MAINLSREFVEAGHDVDFLLGSREGDYLDSVPDSCEVIFPEQPGASHWRNSIISYIDQRQPFVLLGMMEGASIIAIQASRRSKGKVPVVARIPNHFSTHCRESPRWKERYLMPLAARWYLPKAKRVVAISEGVKEDVISTAGLKKNKAVTIYNPAFECSPKAGQYRRVHSWLDSKSSWISVVTAGRLSAQKQQDVLLKAIALANLTADTRLVILGQGECEEALRLEIHQLDIADKVDLVGFVNNPLDYFAQADVFALSSAWEGFGNVLVEALGVGATVVSTDCPSGPSEILAKGHFGQLVPVGDSQAMADAILRAKEHPVDPAALAEHLKQFEAQTVARQYLRVMGVESP
ncbi:glycosyltransferase [Halomonas sp. ATCH28]|uniref:Glycosyltransferase n=2 Tax=Halomonas gemina TaxID=2945105 RepID=A0ABT0SXQ9_9GAMM|nr:glycosyltransferase [Halomonas gemina]